MKFEDLLTRLLRYPTIAYVPGIYDVEELLFEKFEERSVHRVGSWFDLGVPSPWTQRDTSKDAEKAKEETRLPWIPRKYSKVGRG